MDRREQVQYLNQTLLAEMPQYREQAEAFPVDAFSQRRPSPRMNCPSGDCSAG